MCVCVRVRVRVRARARVCVYVCACACACACVSALADIRTQSTQAALPALLGHEAEGTGGAAVESKTAVAMVESKTLSLAMQGSLPASVVRLGVGVSPVEDFKACKNDAEMASQPPSCRPLPPKQPIALFRASPPRGGSHEPRPGADH